MLLLKSSIFIISVSPKLFSLNSRPSNGMGMNQMSHESHARMKQHQSAQQQQQQHQQQHLKGHLKESADMENNNNHNSMINHMTTASTTSPPHPMSHSASTPSTTGTSPDLMNYQNLTTATNGGGHGHNGLLNTNCISPKTDHSHHSSSSPYGHNHSNTATSASNSNSAGANLPPSNIANVTSGLMSSAHHHHAHHLNLNLNSQVLSQSSPQHHHGHSATQVMGSANIYSSLGQPYMGDNSNYGPIYHHNAHYHGHTYGSPYDKIKVTGHMRQSHNISSNTVSSAGNSVTPSANSYTMSSYQTFYGSPHQMMRPGGFIDLVPR